MAYFPNGCSGDILETQCAECPVGKEETTPCCPVYAVQMEFNYKQVKNDFLTDALNYLISPDGICQMRIAVVTSQIVEEPEEEHWSRALVREYER